MIISALYPKIYRVKKFEIILAIMATGYNRIKRIRPGTAKILTAEFGLALNKAFAGISPAKMINRTAPANSMISTRTREFREEIKESTALIKAKTKMTIDKILPVSIVVRKAEELDEKNATIRDKDTPCFLSSSILSLFAAKNADSIPEKKTRKMNEVTRINRFCICRTKISQNSI